MSGRGTSRVVSDGRGGWRFEWAPQCRACDAVDTLEVVRVEVGRVAVGVCSCCAREVRMALAEALGEPEPTTDLSGNDLGP